jgi:DNA-binding HxlR family transcriptional regulator
VRGYGQFCPVARGAEIFAERWTPLILRELLQGSRRFSHLHRGLPRISRALLAQRLRELERVGVVHASKAPNGRGREYRLTPAGEELRPVIEALGTWGYRWAAKDLREDDFDPDLLMWFLRRRIQVDNLPEGRRVVISFRFRGLPKHCYWLVLSRPEADLCLFDPEFGVDLEVTADLRTLVQVYLGHVPLVEAVRSGTVEVSGPVEDRRSLHRWVGISPFAEAGTVRAASA